MADQIQKQIKFAVVMYGGVSLAIYINGIAQELLKMVQSTAKDNSELKGTAKVYRKVARILSDENSWKNLSEEDARKKLLPNDNIEKKLAEKPNVRFVIDVLSGSSAGGINGVFLAKALVGDLGIEDLKRLWLREGDIAKLLNDKKSVKGTNLKVAENPVSLLNGNRMYLKLVEALNGMDKPLHDKDFLSPNVDELDLFVTYTDFAGVPLPLQLAEQFVRERKHKQVFNFRYVKEGDAIRANDFSKKYNPFLAFAARCTSSFPFAFEPMKLTNIDEIIAGCLPADVENAQDKEIRQKFFPSVNNAEGKAISWENRWLVDGGYLDNKPFGFAIETIAKRQSAGQIERKLIYIDPFPENFAPEKDAEKSPDVLKNALAAAMDLPRYETIREDLQRVLERNRLIERVNKFVSDSVDGFEKANAKGVSKKSGVTASTDWTKKWLDEIVSIKGEAFLPYYYLRVSAVTDELTKIAAKQLKIEEDSGYFKALRALIRAWRDTHFSAYQETTKKTYNKFLSDYDIDYRLRRLQFILEKTEKILLSVNKPNVSKELFGNEKENKNHQISPALVENAVANQQGLVSDEIAWKYAFDKTFSDQSNKSFSDAEIRQAVNFFREKLVEAYNIFITYRNKSDFAEIEQMLPEFQKSVGEVEKSLTDYGNKQISGNTEISAARVLEEIINAENSTGNGSNNQFKAQNIYDSDAAVKNSLGKCGEIVQKSFKNKAIDEARKIVYPLIGLRGNSPVYPVNTDIEPKIFDAVREYLKIFYVLFDSYDQISFPIYYQTPVGEAVTVDVVRISPQDGESLINEKTDKKRRKKIAGDSLFAFGGFLDESWRQNDIMWGRFDAAERLIQTLLPGKGYENVRTVLIQEANEAILKDEFVETNRTKLKENVVRALVEAKGEAEEQGAINKMLAEFNGETLKTELQNVLNTALADKNLGDNFKENYQVNLNLEPKPLLQTISRSTQITGKILQGVSETYGQDGNKLVWISRFGYIFSGLIEVAAPHSTWHLLFNYWLKLIYAFEVLLIIGGTLLASSAIQQFGIVAFALTAGVHLAVLTLHDAMNGTDFVKLLRTGVFFAVLILAILGFFALYVFLFADDKLLNFLADIRGYLGKFEQLKNLLPIGGLAILMVGLLVWREVRKKNLRFFGWTIVISTVLFLTFFLTVFEPMVKDAKGLNNLPPVLSLEFITSFSEVACITNKSDVAREGLKTAMWLDSFVIVPFYVALFLLLSQVLAFARKGWLGTKIGNFSYAQILALIAAVCAILGGLGDVVENFFSHWILSITEAEFAKVPWLVSAISWASHLKFGLIFVAVLILSLLFFRFIKQEKTDYARLSSLWLLGIILVMCGIFGIYGTLSKDDHHFVEIAMKGAFIAPLFAGIIFIWQNRDFLRDL